MPIAPLLGGLAKNLGTGAAQTAGGELANQALNPNKPPPPPPPLSNDVFGK
jgi:hypothetical protein